LRLQYVTSPPPLFDTVVYVRMPLTCMYLRRQPPPSYIGVMRKHEHGTGTITAHECVRRVRV